MELKFIFESILLKKFEWLIIFFKNCFLLRILSTFEKNEFLSTNFIKFFESKKWEISQSINTNFSVFLSIKKKELLSAYKKKRIFWYILFFYKKGFLSSASKIRYFPRDCEFFLVLNIHQKNMHIPFYSVIHKVRVIFM